MDPAIGEEAKDAVVTGIDVNDPAEPGTAHWTSGHAAGIDSADANVVDATESAKDTTAEAAGTDGEGARDGENAQDGGRNAAQLITGCRLGR